MAHETTRSDGNDRVVANYEVSWTDETGRGHTSTFKRQRVYVRMTLRDIERRDARRARAAR